MGTARRLTIRGRVQGVFFRAWTKQQAEALGIGGWVRNCPDGSVEALVAGDADAVEAMIGRMRQGPPGAKVEQMIEAPSDETAEAGFAIRH